MSPTKTPIPRPRARNKLAESDAVRQAAEARRLRAAPITLLNIGRGTLMLFQPKDFDKLHIDHDLYQRPRNDNDVNDLIHVILSKGFIQDGVVARRPDGSLWIVDGQQRFLAHKETGTPWRAMVYDISDTETEADLYNSLNNRRALTADNVVKASRSPVADMIREFVNDEDSPLYEHVNFGDHHARPYSASVLARGIFAACTGLNPCGNVRKMLSRATAAYEANPGHFRARALAYMRLASAIIVPPVQFRWLFALGLANVAHKRWANDGSRPALPTARAIGNMKRVNWEGLVDGRAQKYLINFERAIEQRW